MGPNFVFVLGVTEFIICSLFLVKIVLGHFYLKLRYKAKSNNCFWVYTFGLIALWLYSVMHNLSLLYNSESFDKLPLILNPVTIDYFRNILFTGFFIYISVFGYKLVTNVPAENVYFGNARTKMVRLRHATNAVYVSSVLSIFLQVVMVGLVPHFFNSTIMKPELVAVFSILPNVVALCYYYFGLGLFKSILSSWIWYGIASMIVLPISVVLDFFNYFSGVLFETSNEQTGLILMICLRAPLIVLRLIQFACLIRNLFRLQDVRLCHD